MGSRGHRLRDVRHRWEAAERRVAHAAPGGPEWDAARAAIDDLEATYMTRLDRILDRSGGPEGEGAATPDVEG